MTGIQRKIATLVIGVLLRVMEKLESAVAATENTWDDVMVSFVVEVLKGAKEYFEISDE